MKNLLQQSIFLVFFKSNSLTSRDDIGFGIIKNLLSTLFDIQWLIEYKNLDVLFAGTFQLPILNLKYFIKDKVFYWISNNLKNFAL